ncbi:hypothetical protein VNO80_30576 [Phaseolus coccineus]|uniref:Uncharacterized protein n=1 Tax=Phaseolus coccineus TaxID=3886 RepID=A0AAN9QFX3_PHACN
MWYLVSLYYSLVLIQFVILYLNKNITFYRSNRSTFAGHTTKTEKNLNEKTYSSQHTLHCSFVPTVLPPLSLPKALTWAYI